MNLRRRLALPIGMSLLVAGASAQTNVFLDYTDFGTRLDEAFNSAGIAPLDATERAEVQNSIQSQVRSIYGGFTLNVTTTAPTSGNYERVVFSQTASSGSYGLADRIDWRNANKNDVARVYTANFRDFLNSSLPRTTNIQRITNSLARTTAHELGHNLGLSHYDCYECNSRTGYTTQGQQNRNFMGTGSTGASVTDRVTYAEMGTLMRVKLEYAEGVSPSLGLTVNETLDPHGTIATASALTFGQLSLSNIPAVNVAGSLTAGSSDYFSFDSFEGAAITANILATTVALPGSGSLNTVLTLFDANGTQLFQNNDIAFSGNTFNAGVTYGNDSIILNYIAPTTGRYYVRVNGSTTTTGGNYNLLVTPVPEPATLAALGLGGLALLRRRRV